GNFNGFSLVKDFGFNLMDWQNATRTRALHTLSTVFGMAPRVNPMSPMSMFVDPNQAIAAQGQNAQNQYHANQSNLNAQAAAGNYNRDLLGGAFAGAATGLAGAFLQPKQASSAPPASLTRTPATGYTGRGPMSILSDN